MNVSVTKKCNLRFRSLCNLCELIGQIYQARIRRVSHLCVSRKSCRLIQAAVALASFSLTVTFLRFFFHSNSTGSNVKLSELFASFTGVIVSTPTGSTAYAAAAGASMIHPNVPAIMITPICPHSLSFRPIVVPAGVELKVSLY